eukprot:321130-Rhodomonas_salina.2
MYRLTRLASNRKDTWTAGLSFKPPEGEGQVEAAAMKLRKFFHDCGDAGVVMITGAGVSTESGIPDYRDRRRMALRDLGRADMEWSQVAERIVQHWAQTDAARRVCVLREPPTAVLVIYRTHPAYWARSMSGWKPFSQAQPCVPISHRRFACFSQRDKLVLDQDLTQ